MKTVQILLILGALFHVTLAFGKDYESVLFGDEVIYVEVPDVDMGTWEKIMFDMKTALGSERSRYISSEDRRIVVDMYFFRYYLEKSNRHGTTYYKVPDDVIDRYIKSSDVEFSDEQLKLLRLFIHDVNTDKEKDTEDIIHEEFREHFGDGWNDRFRNQKYYQFGYFLANSKFKTSEGYVPAVYAGYIVNDEQVGLHVRIFTFDDGRWWILH